MRLSKSVVKALVAVLEGSSDLESLQRSLEVSQPRASQLIDRLEQAGFLEKKREGMKIRFEPAKTPYSMKFREMYIAKPHMKFPLMLSGNNLDLLSAIIPSPKAPKTIARMLGAKPRATRERLRKLGSLGVISRSGKKYGVSDHYLFEFLGAIRNYAEINGILLWKLRDEMLYISRDRDSIKGHLTGFNQYSKSGVEVNTISYLCWTGKKPSKQDVFIHSLFQVNDPRTLGLAITYYVKNRIKADFLAEKFDMLERLESLKKVLERYRKGEKRIQEGSLPLIGRETIDKQFELYGV